MAKGGRTLLRAGGGFANMVGRGLEGAAASGAVAAATLGAHHVYDALTKARDFKEMLKSPFNSDLGPLHEQSPDRFNAAFTSLRRVNPALTKDPMVSGAYMRRVMMYDDAGASGVLVEALNQKDRMGTSPMVEALARGNQMGVQHVFQDRANRINDERAVGNAARIEQEKMRGKHESPFAAQEQQDRLDVETHKLMGQALLLQHEEDLSRQGRGGGSSAGPSFSGGLSLIKPSGRGRGAGEPVFSPGGGFVGVQPPPGGVPAPSIRLQNPGRGKGNPPAPPSGAINTALGAIGHLLPSNFTPGSP